MSKSKIGLLALSIAFISIGYARGEIYVMFTKAINICLECIGIG